MMAHDIGQPKYNAFINERLEKDFPVKKFHDPIEMKKLNIYTNLCKKKPVKSNGRVVMLKADRSLFRHIIVMTHSRSLENEGYSGSSSWTINMGSVHT